jgi:hypothetical protein
MLAAFHDPLDVSEPNVSRRESIRFKHNSFRPAFSRSIA